LPDTFRHPFGKPGDERHSALSRRRRSPKRFDAVAIPMLREIWASGDWNQRDQLLTYLVMVRPDEGIDIAWEALECEDETLRTSAAIATMTYVRRGLIPTSSQVEALVAAARTRNTPPAKSFLLWALEGAGYAEYESLLQELTHDESANVRFDANMRLLRMGRDTKAALYADLEQLGWDVEFGVEQLWSARDRLDLTADEETMLRSRIQSKLAEKRKACRAEDNPYNAALGIFSWLREGFPAEPDDIDLMGEAVTHIHWSSKERLRAVQAVAWFNNDRAREWLRRLGEEPYQPSVRREAKRQLKRLTAR
jgi:hypothetical protein